MSLPTSPPPTESEPAARLIVYGHRSCAQANHLRRELERHGIPYEWRDVRDGDERHREELKELAGGFLSVPTVVFPDGEAMVEPRVQQVIRKALSDLGNRSGRTKPTLLGGD